MKIKESWQDWLHKYRTKEIDLIFKNCPDGLFGSGLEIGCGDGFQSKLLKRYIKRLTSSDYQISLINNFEKDVTYTFCDAEKVNEQFPVEHFDIIFSSNLLEHLPKIDVALKNMDIILKSNGIMIHIMPNVFWKISSLALYIPNKVIQIIENMTGEGGFVWFMSKFRLTKAGPQKDNQSYTNNPKQNQPQKGRKWGSVLPGPHGISRNNFQEIKAFTKSKWIKTLGEANFEIVAIKKGPVASSYGFGLDLVRSILEKLGFASEYIYILRKTNRRSKYERWFL